MASFSCIASAACSRAAPQADLRPSPGQNVLLVTIDTLRADALRCYGGPAATPALDRLAAQGVRFDFAHAHAVVTLPSHASILTGRYPFQHGLRDNSGYRLPKSAQTLATFLGGQGYSTAAFVGAFPLHSRFGLNAGFQTYDDRFGESRAPTDFAMPERPATAVVGLAREWLARAGGAGREGTKPWFLWVHVFDPHTPYKPPPPFDAQYASRPYYGEVAATDAALAPLFDDVRAADGQTFVVVTGDHGESLGEHGEASHGLFAYESTLRVPLIVAELGRKAATTAEVSHVPARHVDIVPTILDAVGAARPPDLPGRSLLPAAERRDGAFDRTSYFEAMSGMLNRGWAPLTGTLAAREKFIDLPIPERYDLGADPAESTNLAGRDPARDRTLAATLRAFAATPPGARVAEDAGTAERLRALGYVTGRTAPKERYTDADDPKRLVALDRSIHDAVEAFAAGRPADAAAIYRSVIERRPDMSIAYQHLAFIEAQQGRLSGAIDVLKHATAKGLADPRLIAQLGGYLADSGRTADAIRVLEPVTGESGTDAVEVEALNALGIAYAQARRNDDARRTFERVRALDPASSVALENLGMLALDRGDLAEARRQYRAAIDLNPRASRAHAGLAVVVLRGGDRAAAIEEWTQAVQLDPANFDALYNLGMTLARGGDLTRARPYFERFLNTAPPAYDPDKREIRQYLQSR